MAQFLIPAGPMPTTAAFATLASGTAIKTLLQFVPSATMVAKILEWGVSFGDFTPAAPGKVELIETNVAATVTAAAQADITKLDGPALAATGNQTTNLIQIGAALTGYNASAEGSITSMRILDGPQYMSNTVQFIKQFAMGQEPIVQPGGFCRIRCTFAATVNLYAYLKVEM